MTRAKLALEVFLLSTIVLFACRSAAQAKGLQSGIAYSVGSQLSAVAVADLNLDGNSDLVIVDSPGNAITSTVHVLLGRGDGAFQATLHSAATPNLSAVAIGNFNGDNRQDIAITDSVQNVVTILLGNGDGTFAFKVTLSTGAAPSAIAAADVDKNGALDLVVANSDDMTLSIFTGVGDGTFASNSAVSAGPTSGLPLPGLVGLVIGDFDADQSLDIAVAFNGNAYSILKGNGNGTFGTASLTTIPFPFTNPTAIASVDFNLDGALDLIIPTTGKVLLLTGRNNLTFQSPVPFTAQAWPKAVAVGDANADGRSDLLIANWFSNSASVLLNDGLGGVSATHSYSTVTLPVGVAVGDFNSDGKLDLATCGTPVTPFIGVNNVVILLGNGDGTMRVAFNVDYQTGGVIGSNQGLLVGDFDNDGWPDILAGDSSTTTDNPRNRISVFSLSADFAPSAIEAARQVSPGVPWTMAAGQMTASGNLDVIVAGFNAIEVLPGLGDGTFSNPVRTAISSADQRKLAAGDFDSDGKLDAAYTKLDAGSSAICRVLFGNGDGTFRTQAANLAVNSLVNAIKATDVNGDGRPDIAIASVSLGSDNGDLDIFLGNGDATFVRVGPFKVGVYPGAIAATDLDNDGNIDLAVANTGNGNPGSVSVLIGNGDGTFQPAVTTPLPSRVVDVSTGDFDGNGFQDIVVSEGSGTVDLFVNLGDATFGPPTQYFAGSAATSLVAADGNQDGAPDLLVAAGNVINVFPNTGGTRVQLTSSPNPSEFREQVALTALVVATLPGMPVPSGTFRFTADGTSLVDTLLSGSGSATGFFNSLAVGTHSVQGVYEGDANFFPQTTPAFSQLVNKASTSTALVPSSSIVLVGDPLSLSVSVTPSTSGTPSGSVSLLDGSSVLASPALVGAAAALPNISTSQSGLHIFTAEYSGDTNYLPSVSAAANVAVFATPDFLMSPSSEDVSLQAGQSANIPLSLFLWPGFQPTGPMTFRCSGSPSLSSCSVTPSVVSLAEPQSPLSLPSRRPGNHSQLLLEISIFYLPSSANWGSFLVLRSS